MKLRNKGKTTRLNGFSFVALASIVFVVTAIIASCAWNLEDSDQLGRLAISLGDDGTVSALDLSGFNELSFIIVDADYFRTGGRTIHLSPNGDNEGARTLLLDGFEGTSLADVFTVSTLEQDQLSISRGRALTFSGDIPDGPIVFDQLVVGREYVVWIDGLYEEFQHRIGFATTRIRSGADTPVSIPMNLTQDRFPQFAQLLYDRYVEPFLPPPEPIDIGEFEGFLYQGSGSAIVTVQGEQPREVELDRGWVLRIPFEDENGGTSYNVFVLGFYSEEVEEEEIVVVLLEDGTVLEPSRASYQLQIAGDTMVFPEPGTIFEVDLYLEDGRDYELLPEPTPSLLGTAGFSGGPPSGGGTFRFGVSGTWEEFDLEPANIEISDLTFNYG
ncbi:MAG: hypothetical protein EA404_12515, partial [Spirochaetaceae bacterium]